MKRDQLKPYVYKIKGAKNYGLYDLFNGKFYQITPDGDPKELRKDLLKEKLIFETEGVVPVKIKIDLKSQSNELNINEFQIKLDGVRENTCWSRKVVDQTFNKMSGNIVDALINQLKYLEIKVIRIETDEFSEAYINEIITSLPKSVEKIKIYTRRIIDKEKKIYFDEFANKIEKKIEIRMKNKIDLSNSEFSMYSFFHSQLFNPCLGKQVAVDTNGDIKPCLWLNVNIGNILSKNIKELIRLAKFDQYWELSKNKIDECKECEIRFACSDCRVFSDNGEFSKNKKPLFCKYNPYLGTFYE